MKSTSKNQFAFNLGPPVKLLRDPNERALRLRQVSLAGVNYFFR
jgi:hypothetical protein